MVVVDDEAPIRKYLAEVLSLDGYECKCFQGSLVALSYLAHSDPPPDLVITDIRMPGMNGLELLKEARQLAPDVPVIMISAFYDSNTALEAVKAGAAEYLFKPAKPSEILAVVGKHLHAARRARQDYVQAALASFLVYYRPSARDAAPPSPNGHAGAAAALFQALGFKRYETMQHSMRVAAYSLLLGRHFGLSRLQLEHLERGALLHDIGKIAIPRNILLKPGPLTDREWQVMRTHPHIGFQLLADLPEMTEAAQIVHGHHERHDGKGYPRGLHGKDIPIGARLFSIVDTFDAMTSARAYRRAQSLNAALREIQKGSGTQFDPAAVETFLKLPPAELYRIRERYPDQE